MNRRQIERFFRVLSQQLDEDARAILTGGAAGTLWGGTRPSLDVDFAIELKRTDPALWEKVQEAIEKTTRLTGIPANYAEDIERWGMITLLDYKRHTRIYQRFGRLNLVLLEPAYWSIGKMTRYLESDRDDMVSVFQRQKVVAGKLLSLWGTALVKSPRSAAQHDFRIHVEDFLKNWGVAIWGKTFDAQAAVAAFHRHAGIQSRSS